MSLLSKIHNNNNSEINFKSQNIYVQMVKKMQNKISYFNYLYFNS